MGAFLFFPGEASLCYHVVPPRSEPARRPEIGLAFLELGLSSKKTTGMTSNRVGLAANASYL